VYKDVEFVEYVAEKRGNIEISKIVFPFVIVLTQDCDLKQDSMIRYQKTPAQTQDKLVLSVLVAPLYNVEQVYVGVIVPAQVSIAGNETKIRIL